MKNPLRKVRSFFIKPMLTKLEMIKGLIVNNKYGQSITLVDMATKDLKQIIIEQGLKIDELREMIVNLTSVFHYQNRISEQYLSKVAAENVTPEVKNLKTDNIWISFILSSKIDKRVKVKEIFDKNYLQFFLDFDGVPGYLHYKIIKDRTGFYVALDCEQDIGVLLVLEYFKDIAKKYDYELQLSGKANRVCKRISVTEIAEELNKLIDRTVDSVYSLSGVGRDANQIALALYEDSDTRHIGASQLLLCFDPAHPSHRLYDFAAELLAQIPQDRILAIHLDAAITVFTQTNPDKLRELADQLLVSVPELSGTRVVTLYKALCFIKDYERADRLLAMPRIKNASVDQHVERYLKRALTWREKSMDLDSKGCEQSISFAMLSYHGCGTPVCDNIGDHIQSIAMLGNLLAVGAVWEDPIHTLLNSRLHEEAAQITPINLFYTDRDSHLFPQNHDNIWTPIFGWHMHGQPSLSRDWALPDNVNPLFISLHIATPEMITKHNLALLKQYEPIGCRDYFTVRLLRSMNIRAFFSGCITSTLDLLYRYQSGGDEKLVVSHNLRRVPVPEGYTSVLHTIFSIGTQSLADIVQKADQLLQRYERAGEIRTDLLHCFMPCKAMGAPVQAIKLDSGHRRFEGLTDADVKDFTNMQARFARLRDVFRLILSGADKNAVYDFWQDIWRVEEAATDAYLERQRPVVSVPGALWQAVSTRPLKQSGQASMNLALTLNSADMENFKADLGMLTSQPVHLHCLTRGIQPEELQALALPEYMSLTQYDFSSVDYEPFAIRPREHIQEYDYLLLPELFQAPGPLLFLNRHVRIQGSLRDFYDLDLQAWPLAARTHLDYALKHGSRLTFSVLETYAKNPARALQSYMSESGPLVFPFFNTAALLLNPEKLRNMEISRHALALMQTWGLHAQDILNILIRGNYYPLSRHFLGFPGKECLKNPIAIFGLKKGERGAKNAPVTHCSALSGIPKETESVVASVKEAGLSYLGVPALNDLAIAMQDFNRLGIAGDVIEAGCALGGSAIVLTAFKGERKLFVYDVFGLIPPPSDNDGEDVHRRYATIASGKSAGINKNLYYGYEEDLLSKVQKNFLSMGYDPDAHSVSFIQGLYEDTLFCENKIVLAHIDCDWYESVKICLERIGPYIVPHGRMILDDYDCYSGCNKAVDEFINKNPSFFVERKSKLHLVKNA